MATIDDLPPEILQMILQQIFISFPKDRRLHLGSSLHAAKRNAQISRIRLTCRRWDNMVLHARFVSSAGRAWYWSKAAGCLLVGRVPDLQSSMKCGKE